MSQTMTTSIIEPPIIELEKISLVQQLHDINESEEATLTAFHDLLEQRNLYTPATETTPASTDDGTLLRFLKARKWDKQAAADQFAKTQQWRQENDIDGVYTNFNVDEFEMTKNFFPQWTGRRNRQGTPLYNFVVSSLDSKSMHDFYSTSPQQTTLRIATVAEHVTRFITPLCSTVSPHGRQLSTQTNIIDITGVSLSQFWSLRKHLQSASDLAMTHYPESIEHVFLIGAPKFFPRVLSYAKGWFEPTTTRKIHILSPNEVTRTLLEYIDADDLPKRYGGNLDWEFGQDVVVDEQVRQVLRDAGMVEFPKGTAVWDGARCEVMGTVNGVRR